MASPSSFQPPTMPPLSTTAMDRINFSIQLEKYRDMIFKRWWIIAISLILSIAIGAYKAYHQVDYYQAIGKMMVKPQVSNPMGEPVGEEWSHFYGNQVELMQSQNVLGPAVARLAAFEKTLPSPPNRQYSASNKKGTAIFELVCRSTNRDYAIRFIDEVMKEFVVYKKKLQEEATDYAIAALLQEIERQKKEMGQAETALIEFQRNNNMVGVEGVQQLASQYLIDLKRKLADVRTEMNLLNTESPEQRLERTITPGGLLNSVSTNDSSGQVLIPKGVSAAPSDYSSLRNAIILLKDEREDLSKFLRPRHPKIVRINEELGKKERLMKLAREETKEQVTRYRESLKKQEEALLKNITEWDSQALEANQKLSEFALISGNVARSKGFYEVLTKRLAELDMSSRGKQDLVQIYEKASAPLGPVNSSKSKVITVSGLIGLMVSLLVILALDKFDDRIKTVEEMQSLIEEPVLGQIPQIPGHGKHSPPLLMSDLPEHSTFAESFRHVRSSLMFSPQGGHAKTMAVTSAIPGDGKTTCSVNLALCLAQVEGARMLLIDGDMRKMNVHNYFKMPNDIGLSEILSGQASFSQCIISTGIPNLDVLRAGSMPPNPGELLLGENFKLLLTELGKIYHRIVIDTPPVMSTDDTLSLSPSVDGVIFIVKANQTSFRFVDRCMASLKQRGARIFGVVLNHIDTTSAHYYYYNYYSGYYGYSGRRSDSRSGFEKAVPGGIKK